MVEMDEIKQNTHEKEVEQQAGVTDAHSQSLPYDRQIFEEQPELKEQGT